jgi:putative endonuclease
VHYYVYILTNQSRTLYIGVTNNLQRRTLEHRTKVNPGFTKKYNISILVYFEVFTDIRQAIQREKMLKGWRRCRKIKLIESENPYWKDLSKEWFR